MVQVAGWRPERLRKQDENRYALWSLPYFRISFGLEGGRATAMRLHAGPHSQAGPRLGRRE